MFFCERISKITAKLEESLLVILLGGMIILALLQILFRNLFGLGFLWIEPLVRQMLMWLMLVGAMAATRADRHIMIDAISRFFPERLRNATAFSCYLFAAVVCGLLTYSTFKVCAMEFNNPNSDNIIVGLPLWASLATMPLAFAVMTWRYADRCLHAAVKSLRGGV